MVEVMACSSNDRQANAWKRAVRELSEGDWAAVF
jgi:hypothetical protein